MLDALKINAHSQMASDELALLLGREMP